MTPGTLLPVDAAATPTNAHPPAHDANAFNRIWELFGYAIVDSHGARVGPVNRIWADNETRMLQFIGVTTGWFPRTTRVIPATDAPIDGTARSIRVPYPAARIRGAPGYNTDIPLTAAVARNVANYYDQH